MSRFSALAASAFVFAASSLSPNPSHADGLECDISPRQSATGAESEANTTVCASAAEFGWQAGHIRSALQSRNTFRFPENATSSGQNLSTQGTPSAYMGLASISTQRTSGAFDGNASGLILGVDRSLESGNFVLGAMINIGRSDVTPPSSPKIERTELLFGPYFTGELMQDLYLDGYLLYGTPEYTVGGTDSDGETWIGGLTLTKAIIGDAVNWFPFAAIAIRREEPDSSTEIDSSILTLGTTAHFAARQFSGGLNQSFASFELDIGRYEDNLGTEINYTAPRVGLGTEFAFVNGGTLRLGLNGTRGSDDTDMLSLQVSYRLQF